MLAYWLLLGFKDYSLAQRTLLTKSGHVNGDFWCVDDVKTACWLTSVFAFGPAGHSRIETPSIKTAMQLCIILHVIGCSRQAAMSAAVAVPV